MKEIHQGDIWLVDFNPVMGDEMKKVRPAVVVNGDFAVGLNLKIVVPITSWRKDFEKVWWLYKIKSTSETGLETDSAVNCYQVRCVADLRFIQRLGICKNDLEEIIATIQNCLEIIEFK